MKKFVALFLAAVLFCSTASFTFAEDEEKSDGFFDSVGSFFSDTWNDATDWVEGAWDDSTEWVEGAWDDSTKWIEGAWNDTTAWLDGTWGDASKWIGQAWNKSSAWVSNIWGDASGWVSDTAIPWVVDTFNSIISDDSDDVWEWMQKEKDHLMEPGIDLINKVKTAITSEDDDTEEKLKTTIFVMLDMLGIVETDAEKVWETITADAEQKGISPISLAKIAIPYLLRLCANSSDQAIKSIPAKAIAQYITGVIEKLGVKDNAMADELVQQLNDIIIGF